MSNDITATYSTGTNTTATINSNSTGPNNVSVTSPSVAQLQSNVNKFTGLIKKIYFIDAAYDNFYTYSEANTALSILGLKIEPSVSATSAIAALNHENLASSAVILITGSLHLVGDILERNS